MTPLQPTMPNSRDDYLFDLRGYLFLSGALALEEVAALNDCLDTIPPLEPGQWHGHVHRQIHEEKLGINLQQIYEAGAPFEKLIDHPSWIEYVCKYVGAAGTFDSTHGPVFIDENFVILRGPGQSISLHSGGHEGSIRTQFRFHNGGFHCGQVNLLIALTDINTGDGGTLVIPGSHKSNLIHPEYEHSNYGEDSVDAVEGASEVSMKAGDAILFVDSIAHGSAERTNPGQRRICVLRYGPSWGNFRYGYQPSEDLLSRLTPSRRQIVKPLSMIPRS